MSLHRSVTIPLYKNTHIVPNAKKSAKEPKLMYRFTIKSAAVVTAAATIISATFFDIGRQRINDLTLYA